MKSLDFGRVALSIAVAAAMLTGCGGSQPPIGGPRVMPLTRVAKGQALLYVSSIQGYGAVNVYTFPQAEFVGSLGILGQPGAMCTDRLGDVFIPEGSVIAEYAYGAAEPLATFSDPNTPFACAVDPTTGDLGVTNGNRSVAIFNTKSGSPPTFYSNTNVESYYFTSYDAQGSLFAVAFTFARGYRLYELAKGSSRLKEVKVPFKICCPDWIGWDGTDLAIDVARPRNNALIYRIRINNYRATIVGKLKLHAGATYTVQSWIEGKTIVHPDHYNEDVAFWKYPKGGKAWKTFMGAGTYILGVTVSNPSK